MKLFIILINTCIKVKFLIINGYFKNITAQKTTIAIKKEIKYFLIKVLWQCRISLKIGQEINLVDYLSTSGC